MLIVYRTSRAFVRPLTEITGIIEPNHTAKVHYIIPLNKNNMLGTLKANEIEAVLKHQIIARLACHADDKTYIIPLSYAYDGVYVYGRSQEGMKINMMRKNPRICLQVDIMENMANWQSVVAWGDFEELTDPVLRNDALQKLVDRKLPMISSEMVHLSPQWPFPVKDIATIPGVVFRIKLVEKTGRFENSDLEINVH